tara:strand:+ start:1243 stop:1533 length:291 start_codon:yes stop_codon:yes gene_type:complete
MIVFTNSLRVEKSLLKGNNNFDLFLMVSMQKIKACDDLNQYQDLKEDLLPPIAKLPYGSINTKVIILDGQIVERVYKTPNGELISRFFNSFAKEVA